MHSQLLKQTQGKIHSVTLITYSWKLSILKNVNTDNIYLLESLPTHTFFFFHFLTLIKTILTIVFFFFYFEIITSERCLEKELAESTVVWV